uniref:Minor capsid protein P9 transmembrane helices domain-containing protein n=1 Tax=viral metagenome TaxID=1070528 RepID=A0A6C0D4E8_9ZZZZ
MSFWVNEPTILFNKKYITQIWPYSYLTYDEKLNAITRFVILITLLGYVLLNRFIIIVLGLIVVGIIVLLYKKKEGLLFPYYGVNDQHEIEQNNPFGNVLMTDYKFNPNKKEVTADYTPDLENSINRKIKDFIVQENNDNNEIYNLFNNIGDQFSFEQNNRQFYTNPSTTIPNKQDDFLSFCFGTLPSEKPLTIY